MTTLRLGTRGSDLALWQSRWFARRLEATHSGLVIEEVILQTHGDIATTQRFDRDWPVGGFVGAIEQALAAGEIDLAVHSFKDLQTAVTAGLTIAAIPGREAAHDVLVTRKAITLTDVGDGFRLGTSSPRRMAQFRRLGDIEIVEIRGNVATRIAKLERENLDGVVLAAAGLNRLDLRPVHRIDLPTDRFVPSPAQGALAIQVREGSEAAALVEVLDDPSVRRVVTAERSFLRAIGAGCHVPVGALASLNGVSISLHGQLFGEDQLRLAEGTDTGDDPEAVGRQLADRLQRELKESA